MTRRLAPEGGRDEQIRRTARILEIIQQIATQPGRWTRKKLAECHEVSQRMIQKDLEIVRTRLGLSIERERGGYLFKRLPQLPTATYTFSEAVALLSAARLAQAVPGVNSVELAAAIARLEVIFPDELRPLLREATDQLPRQAVKSHRQAMLSLLHRALMEHKQIKISYATSSRAGEVSERTIEPYHLMPYGRSWHLIAYDHQRRGNEPLQFKVDRIQEATLLDTTYTIPASFDVDAYLGDGWGLMRGAAREPEDVVLIFEPQAGRWVAEEQWHKSQHSEELVDGRMQMTFHLGITPEMVRWLLYYGADVWVERPLWLREQVREQHQKALDRQEEIYA